MTTYTSMFRVCGAEETSHIKQAFVKNKNDNWASARVIEPSNRNGYTVMECFTCHAVEATRMRFNETARQRTAVVSAWKAVHRHQTG